MIILRDHLLKWQIVYCLIALFFNLVSVAFVATGGAPLTATDPIGGLIAMGLYASFLVPAYLGRIIFYRALMVLAIIIFGYGGVINHLMLMATEPELYTSMLAGLIGVLINVFGLCLNVIAALGLFKE